MIDLPAPVPAFEFSLATAGMSKGLAQTEGPQAIARAELALGHLYAGAYAKNVTSSSAKGEAAAVIGMKRTKAGFELGASAAWKHAIDAAPGSDTEALEINAFFASRSAARLTPRASITWSPDDLGSTGRTIFAELSATYRILDTVSASAALGRRERTGGIDYAAWNAGLAWRPAKSVTFDVRYYDTDRGSAHSFNPRVVASARLKL